MRALAVGVVVEPQDRKAVDPHVVRPRVHRRRCDDVVLHVVAQRGKAAYQRTMHVQPVPTEHGQRHVVRLRIRLMAAIIGRPVLWRTDSTGDR